MIYVSQINNSNTIWNFAKRFNKIEKEGQAVVKNYCNTVQPPKMDIQ